MLVATVLLPICVCMDLFVCFGSQACMGVVTKPILIIIMLVTPQVQQQRQRRGERRRRLGRGRRRPILHPHGRAKVAEYHPTTETCHQRQVTSPSARTVTCRPVSLSVCLSASIFVFLPVSLSVCLSFCLTVSLSVCLFVCLSVCLSVCINNYMSACTIVGLSLSACKCLCRGFGCAGMNFTCVFMAVQV